MTDPPPTDRRFSLFTAVRQAVLGTGGQTSAALRAGAMERGAGNVSVRLPGAWTTYVDLVRTDPRRINGLSMQQLMATGEQPRAVFEVTVSAATGAALARLATAYAALHETITDAP